MNYDRLTKYTLRQFLVEMARGGSRDARGESLLRLYDEYVDLFHHASGSSHNHQAWPGGYADHITECLRINRSLYATLNRWRPLPFTEHSAAICLFFHDIEKPFRYGPEDHPEAKEWQTLHRQLMAAKDLKVVNPNALTDSIARRTPSRVWEELKLRILGGLFKKYNIALTPDERNALKYIHGEGDHHRKDERVAGPLAAHVHHCDNISARIWYDKGKGLSRDQGAPKQDQINYDPEVLFPFLSDRVEKEKSAVSQFLIDRGVATFEQLMEATDMRPSSVNRYLADLVSQEAVRQMENGWYEWVGVH